MTSASVPAPCKRLLTTTEAAAYCGLSRTSFENICPVQPVALGDDKRLERYDVRALDEWIDRLKNTPASSVPLSREEALRRMRRQT